MKQRRLMQEMFLRQSSWVMLTDCIWVARRRQGFRMTLFPSISPRWYHFQQFEYGMAPCVLKKEGDRTIVEGQEMKVQLELFEICGKHSVKCTIQEIGYECLESKKSEWEIQF